MARIITTRLVGASPRAAHPSNVHRAVFAYGHAGKIVACWVGLHCIGCDLLPGGAAIGGMRDQNLLLGTLMRPHDSRDIQAIYPRTARASIHREPSLKRVGEA